MTEGVIEDIVVSSVAGSALGVGDDKAKSDLPVTDSTVANPLSGTAGQESTVDFVSVDEDCKKEDDSDSDVIMTFPRKKSGSARSPRRKRARLLDEVQSLGILSEEDLSVFSPHLRTVGRKNPVVIYDDKRGSEDVPVIVDEDEGAEMVAAAMSSKRTEDDEKNEEEAFREENEKTKLCSYEGITITAADLLVLKPECLLNDVIVDMYLKYIEKECVKEDERGQFHFFNSFFVKKLSLSAKDDEHVSRWTRDVNVFDKRFLIIPVNEFNHWILVIVCLQSDTFEDDPSPMLLLFDSLGTCSLGKIGQRIRRWLSVEWERSNGESPHVEEEEEEDVASSPTSCCGFRRSGSYSKPKQRFNSETLPSRVLKNLPHQQNNEDCGAFLLHYCECFVTKRPRRIEDFNSSWFELAEIPNKRQSICKLIIDLSGDMKDTAVSAWNTATLVKASKNSAEESPFESQSQSSTTEAAKQVEPTVDPIGSDSQQNAQPLPEKPSKSEETMQQVEQIEVNPISVDSASNPDDQPVSEQPVPTSSAPKRATKMVDLTEEMDPVENDILPESSIPGFVVAKPLESANKGDPLEADTEPNSPSVSQNFAGDAPSNDQKQEGLNNSVEYEADDVRFNTRTSWNRSVLNASDMVEKTEAGDETTPNE